MSSVDNESRFAPPRAAVADLPEAVDGLVLASRGRRFAAVLIDIVVLILATLVAGWLTPWQPWDEAEESLWSPQLRTALWDMALLLVVNGYLLARRGQTVGKLALGMRIVRPDGSAASPWRVLGLRYCLPSLLNIVPALGILFGLVDSLCIFRASRRCLHDDIADTIVIKA
ncbi:RDD family protein [Sphaerotilaceae bacterium SBD11-9]